MLPEVRESSGVFGETDPELLGARDPDRGHRGRPAGRALRPGLLRGPGAAKNTYGTGCFLLMNTGERGAALESGLLTTIAWGVGGRVEYALEGSVFVAGAAVQWLRDGLGLLRGRGGERGARRARSPTPAASTSCRPSSGSARRTGTRRRAARSSGSRAGTSRAHLIRATLESIAYQTRDVVECVRADAGLALATLRVDGGACRERLPDAVPGRRARRAGARGPPMLEMTALGAAALAGLAVGFWRDEAELRGGERRGGARSSSRGCAEAEREALYAGWRRAVERSRGWASPVSGRRPLVIAHRGASGDRPENTLPAYELAIEQGADMIEIDLHRTRDGAIVVAPRRGSDGARRDGRDRARRRSPRCARSTPGRGERVPTLDEVLDRFGAASRSTSRSSAARRPSTRGSRRRRSPRSSAAGSSSARSSRRSTTRCSRGCGASRRGPGSACLISRRFPDRALERAPGARGGGAPPGAAPGHEGAGRGGPRRGPRRLRVHRRRPGGHGAAAPARRRRDLHQLPGPAAGAL